MSNISKHLGQKSQYKKEYDPSLLVKEPRQSNRTYLNLIDDNLPFVGYDTWQAYEVSALTDSGIPLSFVVKLWYTCSNKYIVESKSLKLYFNSFAMTKMGSNVSKVRDEIITRAQKDLSELLECNVQVNAWDQFSLTGFETTIDNVIDFDAYMNLERECAGVECNIYDEDPSLLTVREHKYKTKYFHTSCLVSCCKVTNQPDSGDVFISICGERTPTPESLLQYIVSFRNENHFHEEICEAIWKRLNDLCNPDMLSVMCLYARRGGIDINPVRVTKGICADTFLTQMGKPPVKMPRQ